MLYCLLTTFVYFRSALECKMKNAVFVETAKRRASLCLAASNSAQFVLCKLTLPVNAVHVAQ